MSNNFRQDEIRRLSVILASLIEVPELQKGASKDTEMVIQAARQAIHEAMREKKTPIIPSELEGEILMIETQLMEINSSKFHYDEKNAYAGGKLVLDCTPRMV